MKGSKYGEKEEILEPVGVYKNLIITQVSAKEGIKRWGEEEIVAIMKELK